MEKELSVKLNKVLVEVEGLKQSLTDMALVHHAKQGKN